MSRKTPVKSSSAKNHDEVLFSPTKSPVTQYESHGHGNLTGTLRKVKDSAADVYNQLHKWDKLNAEGANIVSDIANLKLEKVFSNEEEVSQVPLPEGLEPLCEKLIGVHNNMEKVAEKLKQIQSSMSGMQKLLLHQGTAENILFQTWTIDEFVSTIQQLSVMYAAELELKKSIVENVAHGSNRSAMMFYSSAWIHQPYIEQSAELLLESLVTEAGHK